MLKGFQSNPCGRGLKLQILQTVGSLQLVSSNSEVERIKGVKCLACQWEKGGFGVIPRGEDEGWSFYMQYVEKEMEETVSQWGGKIVLLYRGRQ